MTTRLELFETALKTSKHVRSKHPAPGVIDSVIAQLEYLIQLETARSSDRSRLPNLTIGFLAARDIAEIDRPLADMLHSVADEARRM